MFSHDSSLAMADAEHFLDAWDLGPDGLSDVNLADVVLVGDLNGSQPVPRDALLAGMRARAAHFGDGGVPRVRRTGCEVIDLGSVVSVVTARWEMEIGERVIPLVSDLVLDRSGAAPRCIAYLARQNLLDLV